MTITIDLQPEIKRDLLPQAQAKGTSLAEYVQGIVAREARASSLWHGLLWGEPLG